MDDVAGLSIAAVRLDKPADPARAFEPTDLTVFLDCSDLVEYFATSRFPTGIQRVQIELFKASLTWLGRSEIRSCAYVQSLDWWAELDADAFAALCRRAAEPGSAQDEEWQQAVDALTTWLKLQPRLTFAPATVLINPGTSWWIEDYMSMIREAKACYGLLYVPLMHDMIPLVLPEHVSEGLPQEFAFGVSSILLHADMILCNSESTARDVVRFAATIQPEPPIPFVVRLDAEAQNSAPPGEVARDMVLDAFRLRRGRFVLFVSTLEPRKNHLLVFQGWLRLLSQIDSEELPTLVCVGKAGWKFGAALEFLDRHSDLAGHVLMLSSVSDAELYTLYTECLFTVYASLYEGWGLPVTESLCHGKVCLAADNSSLPEAGGQFGMYFESDSVSSFVDHASRLITDDAARREREQLIVDQFRPRSWPEVLAGLIDGVTDRLGAQSQPKAIVPQIEFGTAYPMRRRAGSLMLDRTFVIAEMLRARGEWHDVEPWGVWSRVRRVRLRFRWPEAGGSPEGCPSGDVFAYLHLRSATRPVPLTIFAGRLRLERFIVPPAEYKTLRVTIPARIMAKTAGSGQTFTLAMETDALTQLCQDDATDPRGIGFGLCGLTLCLAGDLLTRVAILDRELLS